MICNHNNANILLNDNKLFDHFFIFGGTYQHQSQIHEKRNSVSLSLLCAYPSTENKKTPDEIKLISTFCFPDGFYQLNRSSQYSINIIEKFAFFIKESNKKSYVSAVRFSVPKESSAFFANNMNHNYPFCMCMISKNPCISFHIKFMIKLIYVLCGKLSPNQNPQSIPKITNVRGLCYPSLIFDKKYMSIAVCREMKVPQVFFTELLNYQQKKISLLQNLQPNQFLLYPTIHTLLSFSTLENFVQAYTAVLLERKVLFVSKCVSKYSSAIIAMNSLAGPFNNISLVFPIVPKEFAFLLDSPIPYIAGSSFYSANADIIIDLDQDLIITNNNDPVLPSHDELIKKLKTLIEYEKESIVIPNKTIKSFFNCEKINPHFIEFVENIDDLIYPICHIADLNIIVKRETTDMIKILFDGHILPNLVSFVKQTEPFGEKKIHHINNQANESRFYKAFFLTQCGSSLYDKCQENAIDLLKISM